MPIVSLSDWNTFLQDHPNAHFLQTGEWGELKSAFGWEPVRILAGEVGAQILFRRLPLGFTVAYIPKAVIDRILLQEIDSVCKRRRAIFLKIEPDFWDDQKPGTLSLELEASPHNIQPPRTIVIDIRGDEDEIMARMKQKTRYNIRLAEKKGVAVHTWDDIESFYKMMLITSGRGDFGVHSLDYYRRAYKLFHPSGMCELLIAKYSGNPLAALMVFARGRRSWYVYGASTEAERNRMSTYLLQWEAMKWAKSRGCEEYDLWGVPDEEGTTLEANFETRQDGLWGVYRFKRGFGGELKRAAQAMDRVYHPWLYWAYLRFLDDRG